MKNGRVRDKRAEVKWCVTITRACDAFPLITNGDVAGAAGTASSAHNLPITLDGNPVQILPVQGHNNTRVFMVVGAGPGNITLQIGDDGVLLVDTGSEQMADQALSAIQHLTRELTDLPIRWIVNTNARPEHTGGNIVLSKAGQALTEDTVSTRIFGKRGDVEPATVVAQQNVLTRMSLPVGEDGKRATPSAAWPLNTFVTPEQPMYFNDEPIEVIHMPAATTDGDSVVFFRRSNVISTGDIFTTTMYPRIDVQAGGTIKGSLEAINRLLAMAINQDHQEGGTYVIPGEGRLCDQADVVAYREMVTIVRDRIQTMVNRDMSLDQVKAARPTFEYDSRFPRPRGREICLWRLFTGPCLRPQAKVSLQT